MLPPNKFLNLKSINSLCNGTGTLVSEVPTIVRPVLDVADTRMHLDKFMQDTGHNNIQMDRLPSMKCCPSLVANLLFYVVNNAFLPSDLKRWELTLEVIWDPKAKIYSIHPKTAGRLSFPQLQQLLPWMGPNEQTLIWTRDPYCHWAQCLNKGYREYRYLEVYKYRNLVFAPKQSIVPYSYIHIERSQSLVLHINVFYYVIGHSWQVYFCRIAINKLSPL